MESIPTYTAPSGGKLDEAMLTDYRDAGVLVLEGFVAVDECKRLRARALELVEAFDPQSVRHVFSTTKQTQLDDSYFYESGDKIRFFLEDDAFDDAGQLRQSKEHCLNKMGHAMHDLDPVFDAFSRTTELAELARRLGVARGTANARLEKLQRSGIIRGFGPDVGLAPLGYPVMAFTTLEVNQGRTEGLLERLRAVPEVLEVHTIAGQVGPR